MSMEWNEFWWKSVTGPSAFAEKAADELFRKGAAVLVLPEDLPWKATFRRALAELLRDRSSGEGLRIEAVHSDDLPEGDACRPGDWLLAKYGAGEEVRLGYRRRSGRSIQEYLADKGVLRGMLVWLRGLDAAHAAAWQGFAAGMPEGSDSGMILIEADVQAGAREMPRLPVLRYSDYAGPNDAQLFAGFMISRLFSSAGRLERDLLTAMAAEICGTDAELMESVLDSPGELLRDPAARIDGLREDSGCLGRFAALPTGKALEKAVWAAQVRTVFPLLELERADIIETFHSELEIRLRQKDVYQFGEKISDPEELEIGTICWLASQFLLKNLSGAHAKRLIGLRTIRNALAHGHPAPHAELALFLTDRFNWRDR